jgi:CCR4-NOT transcription complex subunit 6
MVVCGDFNSAVDSGPYELLSTGRLKSGHTDLHPFNYGMYSTNGMTHPLQLSSAYAPLGEPAFTNYTGDFVGVLDYLWYCHDTLGVSKVLQPVDEDTVRLSRMPNAYMASDHISILSEFFFKRK